MIYVPEMSQIFLFNLVFIMVTGKYGCISTKSKDRLSHVILVILHSQIER